MVQTIGTNRLSLVKNPSKLGRGMEVHRPTRQRTMELPVLEWPQYPSAADIKVGTRHFSTIPTLSENPPANTATFTRDKEDELRDTTLPVQRGYRVTQEIVAKKKPHLIDRMHFYGYCW